MATNIEMNLLQSDGSYNTLYPRTSYNNVLNAPKLDTLTYVGIGSRIGTGSFSYTLTFESWPVFNVIIYNTSKFVSSYPDYINSTVKGLSSNTKVYLSGSITPNYGLNLIFSPNGTNDWGTTFTITDGKEKDTGKVDVIFTGSTAEIVLTMNTQYGSNPGIILNLSGVNYGYYYFYN